jgi:hypothetical protein
LIFIPTSRSCTLYPWNANITFCYTKHCVCTSKRRRNTPMSTEQVY